MSFIITSRKFFDEFTGSGGGGSTYLNALQGDKITCEIEGYFYWAMTNSKLTFDSASQTISLFYSPLSQQNGTSFLTQGFNIGDTIEVVGTASNDGPYTITDVTDLAITTAGAVVDESAPSASVYGTTLVTDLDFFYDLISNKSSKQDFVSATDKETVQKYSATGLDASVGTPVPLTISTASYGWVTDIVTNDDEGEGFVEGVTNVNYKQSFKITTIFYMTRIWTNQLMQNFLKRTAPEEYVKGNHLKHIFKIDGKFSECDPLISHTGIQTEQDGESGWLNQNNCGNKPEYSISSIQYQNDVSLEILNQLEGSIVNLVTIVIESRSGKFVAGNTKFILNHFLCPLDELVYINTDTTLLQNIRLDKQIITMDAASVDGIEFGTDYQSLTDIEATFFSATQVIITFKVDYSSVTKNIISLKDVSDRLYSIVVSCQDESILTTIGIDRVNVLCDFNVMDYDVREPLIFGLVDYIHCFKFPNYGTFEDNDIVGYEGDPAYVEIPFWIETAVVNNITPTLKNISCKIVSTKTDEDDFILEEKIFDTSVVRKLDDKQTIDILNERGFIFADDNPFNRADIVRYEDGDSGTMIAYKLRYAFALRYETWLEVVQSSQGASYDIFKNIEEVNQAWKQYSTGFGWALKFRMDAQVEGYTGFVTSFQTETTFTILENGDAPQDGVNFKSSIKYYNEDAIETGGLVAGEKIRVVARFGGDPTTFPTGMTELNGFIFADDEFGSIFTRINASLDFDSEEDSPFSAEDLPVLNGVVSEIVATNLRMSVFANRIELDTWYTLPDDASGNKSFWARIIYQEGNILLQEDGSAILQEDNFAILL